jgi:hypothetical protein
MLVTGLSAPDGAPSHTFLRQLVAQSALVVRDGESTGCRTKTPDA